jgi:hypothetical protein
MNKINEIGDTPRGRGWLGAVQARAMNRRDRARLNAEIPRSERERESKKQDDIMKRAVDTAYKNSNTSDALTFRQMRAGANDFYRKNNYSRVPVDYEDTMWDEWNESKKIGGNRINEIGDTPKGQEALGRTAERAYQRAQRTSGADKKRYEKTFNDAYRTGGKSANKHLGGSREHFDNGRDYEHEKWEKEHNGNVAESKNMNKKIIRLTESDLHRIVKESVNRILKESDYRGLSDGHYDMPEGSTIEALVNEIEKDYNSASKPFYSRGEYHAGRQGQIDSYLSSMTKAIVNDFSKEDYLKALEMFGLNIRPEAMQEFDRNWNFCIQDLQDEIRRSHQAWAEDRMSDMGFGFEGD